MRFDQDKIDAIRDALTPYLNDPTLAGEATTAALAAHDSNQWLLMHTAPKGDDWILVTNGRTVFPVFWSDLSDAIWDGSEGWVNGHINGAGKMHSYTPTYWMPLPIFPRVLIDTE